MRLWSLNPRYLDSNGLIALWRESLLAKHVLEGNTTGYRNHPQLERFKQYENPVEAINYYLSIVYKEAVERKYNFDKTKIDWDFKTIILTVTDGQLKYEMQHLLNKLKIRDNKRYKEFKNEVNPKPNPMFKIIKGDIEGWEKRL